MSTAGITRKRGGDREDPPHTILGPLLPWRGLTVANAMVFVLVAAVLVWWSYSDASLQLLIRDAIAERYLLSGIDEGMRDSLGNSSFHRAMEKRLVCYVANISALLFCAAVGTIICPPSRRVPVGVAYASCVGVALWTAAMAAHLSMTHDALALVARCDTIRASLEDNWPTKRGVSMELPTGETVLAAQEPNLLLFSGCGSGTPAKHELGWSIRRDPQTARIAFGLYTCDDAYIVYSPQGSHVAGSKFPGMEGSARSCCHLRGAWYLVQYR